jgi:type I restriction enzyme S subunit
MTVGRVGITIEDMLSNEAIAHFRIKDNRIVCAEFIYLYLKSFKYETLGSTSSIVTSINSTMIKELPIFIPNKELMRRFKEQTTDIFLKIKHNQKQIKTLESLRDTLLPKLISGDVRIEYEEAT